jgi:integrase
MTTTEQLKKRKKPRGIFERPKGSGVWWIRYHDQNGQEHREKAGTKKLALDVYAKRKTQVREGIFFPELIRRREVRLADVIDQYVAARADRHSHRELHRYGEHWKRELGTDRTLRQVDEAMVERIAAKRREKVSEQTLAHELIFLRAIYKRALVNGTADRNPVGKVPAPRNQRVRYLDPIEEEPKLRAKMTPTNFELVAFALNTGLRQGRQFALRWAHVDMANGVIRIPKSKNRDAYTVPLNDTAKRILRRRPRTLKSPFVFPNQSSSGHLDGHNFVRRVFNPAVAAAGITDFHWHDLRHTFASRLAMSSVELATIKELLNHRSISQTTRYAHLSPGHQREAVQRLNGFGKQPPTGTATGTDTGQGNGEVS